MSHALRELRDILARPAPARGRVVRVTGASVQVATGQGVVTLQAGGALTVGQQVVVSGGAAYPQAVADRVYAL